MSELNKDVIFLILKILQNDSKSFYSCLLINRIWCETVVPILWKNPTDRHYLTENACKILLNVILSHLSGKSKDNMMRQGIDLFTETYQRPLFNYISFWKHLDSKFLEYMMYVFVKDKNIEISKISIIREEILNLFNINTTFNSLSIKSIPKLSYLISGTELYFSKLEYFYCDSNTNSNFLGGLALTNTSIKKLSFNIMVHTNNPGIIKLIKVQKNLKEINFIYSHLRISNELCHKSLEESLINCENTIQYLRIDWKPITNFLSNLVNLVSLYIINSCYDYTNWNHLEKVSLPLLKFLKTHQVPSWILACLIKNTKGNLIEINTHYQDVDDGRLLKAISQNCPKLCYLRLSSFNSNTLDFENLLINCQSLIGLQIVGIYGCFIDWDKLFETLTKSSPFSLFKFKFSFSWQYKLKALKSFLDNWNDKNPILLQIISTEHTYIERQQQQQLEDLFQIYKGKGIIKKYDLENPNNIDYEDFEWIQKKGSDTII